MRKWIPWMLALGVGAVAVKTLQKKRSSRPTSDQARPRQRETLSSPITALPETLVQSFKAQLTALSAERDPSSPCTLILHFSFGDFTNLNAFMQSFPDPKVVDDDLDHLELWVQQTLINDPQVLLNTVVKLAEDALKLKGTLLSFHLSEAKP